MTAPTCPQFTADTWANGSPAIDVSPYEYAHFLILLQHLCTTYGAPLPAVVETLDGYLADLELLGARVQLLLDNWTFSFAFSDAAVRDRVLADLQALPRDAFAVPPSA